MHLLLLILPLVAAIPLQSAQNKYDLTIENGKLKSVKFIELSDTLDLSNLGLSEIDRNAFEHVTNIKILNLSSNSLTNLPPAIFSDLKNLIKLSLARNKIDNLGTPFVGLEKLNELDISYNPIDQLKRGNLYGLNKYTDLITSGNVLSSINTDLFVNDNNDDDKRTNENKDGESTIETIERKIREIESNQEKEIYQRFKRDIGGQLAENPKVKLCTMNDVVTLVNSLNDKETLPRGCQQVTINQNTGQLDLRNMNIKSFQNGWYQLNVPISSIDLSENQINEITKELLNGLPANVEFVNFANNEINHLRKDVIENPYLKRLNFKANVITDIDKNTFDKTNLISLFLADNQLTNLDFVQTLPSNLSHLVLTSNQIASIERGTFLYPKRLTYINLGHNKITKLRDHTFEGQENLPVLILTRNRISEIEPKAFSDLKMLTTLYLYQNLINKLPRNVLTDLTNLQELNLMGNKFTTISEDTFPILPKSLASLNLDANEIKSLEKGSFVDAPEHTLSLNQNQISNIAPGAFQLPNLRNLYLRNNMLTTINGDSYQGLPKLLQLSLSNNKIDNIEKGSCKHLATLQNLHVSGNPFQRLDNAAFYGLTIGKSNFVEVENNQLKSMKAGIFEDV